MSRYPEFTKLYSKNGFVFLIKKPYPTVNSNEFKTGI
jgi:hypothetical protein